MSICLFNNIILFFPNFYCVSYYSIAVKSQQEEDNL